MRGPSHLSIDGLEYVDVCADIQIVYAASSTSTQGFPSVTLYSAAFDHRRLATIEASSRPSRWSTKTYPRSRLRRSSTLPPLDDPGPKRTKHHTAIVAPSISRHFHLRSAVSIPSFLSQSFTPLPFKYSHPALPVSYQPLPPLRLMRSTILPHLIPLASPLYTGAVRPHPASAV